MQNTAWLVSIVMMGLVAAVFLWVVAGASQPAAQGGGGSAAVWRGRLFWVAIVAGAVLSFATPKPDVVIRATGHQFRWQLDQDSVRVGELVEFQLTSSDVNHGFALYQGKNRLVAQTQAMPGYVNKLQVRFTEPGEYEVLCLEYCGVAHHNMRAVVKVRAGS
jgi:cytochrome c oxidase subunit 2